jgi:tetratricopeptide (TPR) repeat protein
MKNMLLYLTILFMGNNVSIFSDTSSCFSRAMKFYKTSDYGGTISVIADCKKTPELDRLKGLAYSNSYNADSALYYLQAAYKSNLSDDTLLVHLSRALLWKKDLNNGSKLISKIQDKSTVEAMKVEALRLKLNNNFRDAYKLYDAILAKKPDDFGTLFDKAELACWDKKFDVSMELLDKLITNAKVQKQLKHRAMNLKAQIRSWNKDFGGAHAILETVMKEDRENIQARLLAGEIFEWEGKYKEAKDQYRQALIIDNGNKEAKLRMEKLMWVK